MFRREVVKINRTHFGFSNTLKLGANSFLGAVLDFITPNDTFF